MLCASGNPDNAGVARQCAAPFPNGVKMNQLAGIKCCPGCGRPLPRDDLVLPPVKRRIYDIVSRRPGIAAERLRELVWSNDPAGGPEDRKVLHVHVCQLNQLLAPYRIEVRGSVSRGYRVQFCPSRSAKEKHR